MRTSVRPAVTPGLDFSRPAPSAGPHLIDGASEAPEIFGEPTPLPDEPAPEPVDVATLEKKVDELLSHVERAPYITRIYPKVAQSEAVKENL